MAKTIHMMIRVLEEARSVKFYETCFGLKVADRKDWPDFTLIYMSNPESRFELEMTVNKGRADAYDLGNGYGHLAFSVDDLEATRAKIVDAGYQPKDIKTMTHDGQPFAQFFFIEDPDGYKIEVLARGGRFQ
jgi:lactoylglutathione lyase